MRRPLLAQTELSGRCPAARAAWAGAEGFEAIAGRLEGRGLDACFRRPSDQHGARGDEAQQSYVDQYDRDEDFYQREAARPTGVFVLPHAGEAATIGAECDTKFNRAESNARRGSEKSKPATLSRRR